MTDRYSGGRLCSVQVTSPGPVESTSMWWNHSYANCALIPNGGVFQVSACDPTQFPLLVPLTIATGNSFNFHAVIGYGDGFRSNNDCMIIYDAAGHPWIKFGVDGSSEWTLLYNSGTGISPIWTSLGTTGLAGYTVAIDLDIRIDINSAGEHTALLAINRTAAIGPASFTQASMGDLRDCQMLRSNGASSDLGWSEILIRENQGTVGSHVFYALAAGAGADADWTGAYTDVNEVPVNDTTANLALTSGLSQTYPMTTITVPDGYVISSVWNWLRIKNDGSAPENVQSICRPGATDHVSADLSPTPLVTYGAAGAAYPLNPDTSAPWTQSDWNAPAQLGFKSAT